MCNSDKVLINVNAIETRVAWVKDNLLQEIWIERHAKKSLVGNIYLGVVVRVLPGMQSVFVDIGLDKKAFLSVADISQSLRAGQKIIVQILKNPLNSKGAKLTMSIALTSRLLVLLPDEKLVMVSQKINGNKERQRLKTLVKSMLRTQNINNGFIIRTEADGINLEALSSDIMYLEQQWLNINNLIKTLKKPALIYTELPLFLKVLRDYCFNDVVAIKIDCANALAKMQEFAKLYYSNIDDKLKLYNQQKPIFDLFNIENSINQALKRTVNLNIGGYLVFDKTEAMTTIDINTGSFIGSKNLEKTIYKTNLEAVIEIAKQLKLRNIAGIIIIDLINMVHPEHNNKIYLALKKALTKDKNKTTVSKISELGLIEMTRQKVGLSLDETLCMPCKVCDSKGTVKNIETIVLNIFREINNMTNQFPTSSYTVIASEEIIAFLNKKDHNFLNKKINLQANGNYLIRQFDILVDSS